MPPLNGNEWKKVNPSVNSPQVSAGVQKLIDQNPYMNLDYKESGLQKFLSNLGFRTGYDKRMEDMQLQANETNFQLALMDYQNQYNSEVAKSQRMRAAGLNPDLQGIGDASESAGISEDTNPPAPTETDMETVSQFANVVMSAVSTSMGLMKDFQGLKQIQTSIEAGDIDNARNTYNLALQAVLGASPADPFVEDKEHGSYLAAGIGQQIADAAKSSFGQGLSKRRRKYYESAVDQLVGSLPATKEQYAAWRDQMKNKIDMFQTYNSPEYSPWEPALSVISEELSDLMYQVKTSGMSADVAENTARQAHAENVAEFETAIDPTLAADVENQGRQFQKKQYVIGNILRSKLEDITTGLERIAKKGGLSGTFAELMLMSFSLMSLTQFNFSQKNGFSIGF